MDLVNEINRLKEEKNAIILVHNYQRDEVQDIADILGDSLDLSKKAKETDKSVIVFCGVRFMAETAKILSPDKTVLLPAQDAGCPMADTITAEQLAEFKAKYPGYKVVSYVNTNADVKSLTDVCCTSANAIDVVKNYPSNKLLFVPDKNLGNFVKQAVPEKDIVVWDGGCHVHQNISLDNLKKAKELHPDAIILVHPEANPEVVDYCDEALSTNQMINYIKKSDKKEFIIVTESGIIHRMQKENPDKKFYNPGSPAICPNMKKTTLQGVYNALKYNQFEIKLDDDIIEKSQKSLNEMLKYLG